ncbi:hypothetical protein [Kozakia baliensis]|uniref:hypothetical protein n=2 Tax=Kozakia baliensis TaxID=153496 RepID=UPI0011DF5D31|nr:hypothetical protein [Kozakia baliensis]
MKRFHRFAARFGRRLKNLIPPPATDKHREDRLKAIAGVFQNIALAVWGIGILTPIFTAVTPVHPSHLAASGFIGLFSEAFSLFFLALVPYKSDKEDNDHGPR